MSTLKEIFLCDYSVTTTFLLFYAPQKYPLSTHRNYYFVLSFSVSKDMRKKFLFFIIAKFMVC